MILVDILSAIIVSSVFTIIFSVLLRRRGPRESSLMFFLLVFLGTWAGGLWLKPVETAYNGFHLINYVTAGLLISLLIAATGPVTKRNKRQKVELKTDKELNEETNTKGIDILLTILIFLLIVIIISGYIIFY